MTCSVFTFAKYMFWSKNKKNRYIPANPSFFLYKWGSRGYTLHGHVFLMNIHSPFKWFNKCRVLSFVSYCLPIVTHLSFRKFQIYLETLLSPIRISGSNQSLIVNLVFYHIGFWSGNLFLIAPFPDRCLPVPFCNKFSCLDKKGQVDTFILDFEKAFDTLPRELLKGKLFSYGIGIGGKTLEWINAFLCFRQQRIIVNGVKSDWNPVVSGVPQGTVLGPLLFSLYINDIPVGIDSQIRLLAYDCVCYREIRTVKDTLKLQKDIDLLGSWAKKMGHEISTCQMQHDAADK